MTINEYQRMALRTESNLDEQKLHHKRLLQGLMGLNGEAGECIDFRITGSTGNIWPRNWAT